MGKGKVSLVGYVHFELPWESHVLLSGYKRNPGFLPSGRDGYTWSVSFAAE